MQELIEWMETEGDWSGIDAKVKELLHKEKEQIKDAWEAGEMFGERVERDGLNHTQVIQVRAEYLKNQNI